MPPIELRPRALTPLIALEIYYLLLIKNRLLKGVWKIIFYFKVVFATLQRHLQSLQELFKIHS